MVSERPEDTIGPRVFPPLMEYRSHRTIAIQRRDAEAQAQCHRPSHFVSWCLGGCGGPGLTQTAAASAEPEIIGPDGENYSSIGSIGWPSASSISFSTSGISRSWTTDVSTTSN